MIVQAIGFVWVAQRSALTIVWIELPWLASPKLYAAESTCIFGNGRRFRSFFETIGLGHSGVNH